MSQNSKSNTKITHDFFGTFIFLIHPKSSDYCLENGCFPQSSSSLYFIYNIVIVSNTPTTMNKQFQALNAPKINIYIFIFLFLTHPKIPTSYFKIYKLTRVTTVHDTWSRTSE